ncbi:SNF2-related protein [Mycoplasma sp. Sp48II]|uniref:SNF2-related protein n=1 Tax=Mycoplasma sp. Sp48II TaxID=3401682 RepID=UPI003AACCE81
MTKQLYEYQKHGIVQALKNKRFLLALDMGLGKTFTALNYLHILRTKLQNNTPTFIIVDSNKVDDWTLEASFFNFKNLYKVKKSSDYDKIDKNTDFIAIISYRVLSNLVKNKVINLSKKFNLIIDEAQALKSPTSLISKTLLKYNKYYDRVLLLSGDPLSNGYENLYVLMKLLQLFDDKSTYLDFMNCFTKYYTMPNNKSPWGNQVRIITGYKNVEELIKLVHSKSYFLKSEDAIELPAKLQEIINVKTCDQYYEMKAQRVTDFNKPTQVVADNSISLLHSLRQLASGVIKTDIGSYKLYSYSKLNALKDILNSTKENLTIFYNYKAEAVYIRALLNELEIKSFTINGQGNELAKALEYEGRKVVLIQFISGARGIDGLQEISKTQVYFSPPLSGELFKQSIKRIHRIGQKQDCKYIFLVAQDSIELDIYKALKNAKDYTLKIFEQEYKGE